MKENWTTDMKQKLEGHKMAPPAGLWEGISSEMGLQKEPVSKTVAIRRWHWVVAALVLALVGFFALYQFPQDESFPQVAQTLQEQEPPMMKTESGDNQPLALADCPQRNHTQFSPKIAEDSTPQDAEETSSQQDTEKTSAQQVAEETPQQASVVTHRQQHSEGHHYTSHHQTKQLSASTSDSQWSVGLNASGGLLASSGQSNKGQIGYSSDYTGYNSEKYDPFMPSSSTYDTEAKHRLPLSLGLSVQYQLSPRLAFLTGVNYTYLYSEFSISLYPNIYREQKLHYLGVPVGLSWLFWKMKGFSFYLSGSAMLQKCLNEKPWQWSVNASAGAEYAITPLLGIFLQPSLGYYFHDGTSFEHYYKEHPLAPSIEFGLRLHLSGK